MYSTLHRIKAQTHQWLDTMVQDWMHAEQRDFGLLPKKTAKTQWLDVDDDLKKLIITADSLDKIWQFLLQRLTTGSAPTFILLSTVDDVAELLRLKYLHPTTSGNPFQGEFIPLCDHENHLVKTVLKSDTMFTPKLHELGHELEPYLGFDPLLEPKTLHIFSIPLVAANRTIAVLTLGFEELDSFTQAKLSYVYGLRDPLAQVVWNLILQERIQNQPQLDNLTGLMTYSSFHPVLQKELRQSKLEDRPLSLILIDINGLKAYNEANSHPMGDRAIALLSSLIKHEVRGVDTVARYGNDELAIILPDNDMTDAMAVAESIMAAVKAPCKSVRPFEVTLGVVNAPLHGDDLEYLLQLAQNTVQYGKHQHQDHPQSCVVSAQALDDATDQERLDIFTAQMAKKYGGNSSDLFDTLLKRIERDALVESDTLMLETVASLAGAMDAKDKYTRGHSQSVANYAVALAHAVGLLPTDVERIRLAAFFHDIGKIGIPEAILNKPGPLTDAETEVMKQHPVIGARQILYPVTALRDIVPMVEYHHERWDGLGHPVGLKGENIPIGARIVSVVDAFHALTSNRPYRDAMPLEEALVILTEGAGTLWDPSLVSCFLGLVEKAQCKATVTH